MKNNLKKRVLSFVLAVLSIFTIQDGVTFAATADNIIDNNIQPLATTKYSGGGGAITVSDITVYTTSACTTKKGSLYDNEGFTVLEKLSSGVWHIEYSTTGKIKDGYIKKADANGVNNYTSKSCVAVAKAATKVYYGNSTSKYAEAGSISSGEKVVVISKYGNWSYIEYNVTSDGTRKRGYVQNSSLTFYGEPSSYGDFYLNLASSSYKTTKAMTVYAGPTYRYKAVGSVSKGETINRLKKVPLDNEGNYAYFISYTITGTQKLKTGLIFN